MKYVRLMQEDDWVGSHPATGKVRIKGNVLTAIPDELLDVIRKAAEIPRWSELSGSPDGFVKCEFIEAKHLDAEEEEVHSTKSKKRGKK